MGTFAAGFFANAVLALHVCIAVFVVAGLVLVVVGNVARWRWVNNLWLRVAHLVAIAIVAAEAWFGIPCPLTLLEMSLRTRAGAPTYDGGFIEHWLAPLLYYEAPPSVFILVYSVFGLLVVASWWYFPPEPRHRDHEPAA